MRIRDDWGQDPSVQNMRRVFVHMERAQKELLGRLNISSFDSRLRRWREGALGLFERTWTLAVRRGAVLSEEDVASLYTHCLARVLILDGVKIPREALPQDDKIVRFLQEELP